MHAHRFSEILAEAARNDWAAVLQLAGAEYFVPRLYFNWGFSFSCPGRLEADEVMPFLKSQGDEAVFCLDSISFEPVVEASGEKSGEPGSYKPTISYRGDEGPRWQELHLRTAGKESAISRTKLHSGCKVADTPSGELKALVVDDRSLILVGPSGADSVELRENQEYWHDCFPGVEAYLQYDHKEFPALWSWLHVDDDTEGGENPWYTRHHFSKSDLFKGMECIAYAGKVDKVIPQVTVLKIGERSLTLGVKGKGVDKEVVLDKPNHQEVIWEKGKRSLKAELYVPAPDMRKACHYYGEQTPPPGCRAEVKYQYKDGELSFRSDVRSLYSYLCPEECPSGTPSWNWPCVWGFVGGKMVLADESPNVRAKFKGLLAEGECCNDGDISVRWENVAPGFEVEDGVLKSIPDCKELVVPGSVRKVDYEALLTAPSLKRITIHGAVERFASALENFHRERHRKLDIVFEGSLQDWFNRGVGLCGQIGKLYIGGEVQDFYDRKHLVIPAGISRIGADMFNGSEMLESVVLGPEVVSVGDSAFRNCEALVKVEVLGPAEIGPSAFCSCGALKEVYLSDGVKALYDGCFDFVTTLKKLYIPASVEIAQCLSSQNDGSHLAPVFYCAAPYRPEGWWNTWNLAYSDPRFGLGHGHDHYHAVRWGAER